MGMAMQASRPSAFAFFILTLIPSTFARGRGGSIGGDFASNALNLDSVETATFSFYIIFTILTALQGLKALGALKKRPQTEDFPRRIPSVLLTLLGICSLVGNYAIGAAIESRLGDGAEPLPNYKVVYAMATFTYALSHVFLYAALFLVLDYRNTVQALQYGHVRSQQFVTVVRVAAISLVGTMLIIAFIRAIIGSTATLSWYLGEKEPLVARAYSALFHFFLALYILATAGICGTALVLWKNRRPTESSIQLLWFDKYALRPIVTVICPIIALRAFYGLILDIITAVPASNYQIDLAALDLADIIIVGLCYLIVVSTLLNLGIEPKKEDEKGKKGKKEVLDNDSAPGSTPLLREY